LRAAGWRSRFLPLTLALLALLVALPGGERLWRRLHGRDQGRAVVFEDATGVVALTDQGPQWGLAINGKENSWLPFGGIHTFLGALPAVAHANPAQIAVIGLGSGDTAWAAGCRRETVRIDVFEICAPIRPALQQVAGTESPLRDLRGLLSDGRYRFTVADGRNAVESGSALYDVIEIDALRPEWAGSGNLYSQEFLERCGRKLRPGGLMCAWAPTPRSVQTFKRAFPHVMEFADILLGSRDPLRVDIAACRDLLQQAAVAQYLGANRLPELLARLARGTVSDAPQATSDLNHDLFPRDEFVSR
jgi:hypothetical protein